MFRYVLKPAVLNPHPEISITEEEYNDAKRCHIQNYEVFEIELAFEFVVTNYIEIEKYIAEHLVLDMVGMKDSEDAMRAQQWGFMRVLGNWLSSVGFWHNLTRSRLISICGRGQALREFQEAHLELSDSSFEYALVFHLRNYSQHSGFPITGFLLGGSWNSDRTQLNHSADYTLDYNKIRSYFEAGGKGAVSRRAFGQRIEEYANGQPFDLKPVIRKTLGVFGLFMERVRTYMADEVSSNERLVLDLIDRYSTAYPHEDSMECLSVLPINKDNIIEKEEDIIPVRDEFILRARELREKNTSRMLSMHKRVISNA